MAKGMLVGIRNVDFKGKDGEQVKFNKYILLIPIVKFGEGNEAFEVNSTEIFDVAVGEQCEVVFDRGYDGKAVCKEIVSC
jgi:hypothetical protein